MEMKSNGSLVRLIIVNVYFGHVLIQMQIGTKIQINNND